MLPFVRAGQKLKITANTLNEIARHVNKGVAISAGKPVGGNVAESSESTTTDYSVDRFKITQQDSSTIKVSGGYIYNGTTAISCNDYTFSMPSDSIKYYILQVTYNTSTSTYSASIFEANAAYGENAQSIYYLTLGSVDVTSGEVVITWWRYPSNVIISGRWS